MHHKPQASTLNPTDKNVGGSIICRKQFWTATVGACGVECATNGMPDKTRLPTTCAWTALRSSQEHREPTGAQEDGGEFKEGVDEARRVLPNHGSEHRMSSNV